MNLSGTLNLVSDFTINGQLTVGGQVNGPGTLINISTLRLNSATVNAPVDNRSNGMLGVLSGVNTMNGAFATAANSTLQLGGTSTLSVSAGFTNNGTITFAENGALAVMGTLVNSPGGVISSANIGGGFTRNLSATLDNQGTLDVVRSLNLNQGAASHTNSGVIQIAASQTLFIAGDLTQTAAGRVSTTLTSDVAGQHFGTLAVAGMALLDGTLQVNLAGGFMPGSGDSFPVVTYGSRMGEYATVDGGTVNYSAAYGANSLVLMVVAPAAPLAVETLVKAEAFEMAMTSPTAPFITSKRMGNIHSKLIPARGTLRERYLLLAGTNNWTAGQKKHEELLRTRPSLDGLRVVDDLFAELGIEQVAPKAKLKWIGRATA